MSGGGAEVVFLIGLLSGIITLVSTSKDVVGRIIEFTSDLNKAPEVFRNLYAVLRAAELVLQKTQRWTNSGRVDSKTCRELRPIVEGCTAQLKQLEVFLQEKMPTRKDSRLKIGWKAVTSVRQQKKINRVRDQILQNIKLITDVAAATKLTEDEISSIGTRNPRLQIDQQLEIALKRLQAPTYHNNQAQSNTRSFNHSSNHFTYNNFNASVYQFINTSASSHTIEDSNISHDNPPQIIYRSQPGSVSSGLTESLTSSNSTVGHGSAESSFETSPITSNGSWRQQYDTRYDTNRGSSFTSAVDNISFNKLLCIEDSLGAMHIANSVLKWASVNVNINSGQAKVAYHNAIQRYKLINTNDPDLQIRKYRNLTAAAIGLSQVVVEKQKPLENARFYNKSAYKIAHDSLLVGPGIGIMLDKGNINLRAANILQKQNTSLSDIDTFLCTAFSSFNRVCQDLENTCKSPEDWDTLAQALHGCGSALQRMGELGILDMKSQGHTRSPASYFQAELVCLDQGSRIQQ
ncbi:hypothetical protein MMC19_002218 [Ptychographa xylographoides]|nr:hypothetical protein [Ptychographa xylographoides]